MKLPTPFPKAAMVSALFLGATVLTACGGVTVEGNPGSTTTTSIARETATGEETSTRESSTSTSNKDTAPPLPQDQPASEMTEAPATTAQRTPAELDLLDGLKEGGIDIAGVEDQLIATAGTVCRSQEEGVENYTLDAIAGQLITQGRTNVPVERADEVSTLIRETAERTYC